MDIKMMNNKVFFSLAMTVTVLFAVLFAGCNKTDVFSEIPADVGPTSDTEEAISTDIAETSCVEVSDVTTEVDTEDISETTAEISVVIPDTEEFFIPNIEEKKAVLSEKLQGIAEWLETSVPEYTREAETDENGVETAPAEAYTPLIGFYYEDIRSGLGFSYNSDCVFYTASIIKAPYVMWVMSEIEKAEAEGDVTDTIYDVNNIFIYTEDKFKTGSGVIQKSDFGTEFTYLDLLRLSITESDNVAFAELRNIFGRKGFNEFSKDIAVISPTKKLYSASAAEMGAYMKAISQYFEGESKYALMLKEWMLDTNHRIMIPWAVKPSQAANKYGWDKGAYHDGAIVFDSESPYVLVVMTELQNGSKEDNKFIRELISKINEAHKEAFGKTVENEQGIS